MAEVPTLSYAELSAPPGEATAGVRVRVLAARERQTARNPGGVLNADLSVAAVRELVTLDADGRRLLGDAIDRLGLSGRAHDRLLRVARTLADLGGDSAVSAAHVAEALSFRRRNAPHQG